VDILESEEDLEETPRMGVVGFGPTTFQVNDVLVRQSTLLLPTSYFLWSAHNVEDITIDSLSIFLTVHPRLEIVFVGTGRHLQAVPKHVVDHYRDRGVVIEVSYPPVFAFAFYISLLVPAWFLLVHFLCSNHLPFPVSALVLVFVCA
jgi:uncharacterized protein